jgi:hypothetical protein
MYLNERPLNAKELLVKLNLSWTTQKAKQLFKEIRFC